MIFEQVATGGCQSYRLRLRYVIDTHTHADHFSATQQIGHRPGVPIAMHQSSPQPFVDMRLGDREPIVLGHLRIQVCHTPGHTRDSMCLLVEDRVFTGDTLLIGGTGRTDLPTGDPEALHDSLFNGLLQLDPGLKSLTDARDREAYEEGHVPGARLLPCCQLELRVNDELLDPTRRVITVCEFGRISTLAAATLRELGFVHVVALDGGMKAWRDAGFPLVRGREPFA